MNLNLKKLNRILKTAPFRVIKYYIAGETALGFIQGILQKVNILDVYRMIEEDKYNIFDGNQNVVKAIKKSSKIILEYEDVIRKYVTPTNVLSILKDTRPDIYSLIINHKKGVKWLSNAIKTSMNYMFEIAKSETALPS